MQIWSGTNILTKREIVTKLKNKKVAAKVEENSLPIHLGVDVGRKLLCENCQLLGPGSYIVTAITKSRDSNNESNNLSLCIFQLQKGFPVQQRSFECDVVFSIKFK
jgi:hypothetical protein